MAKSTKISVNKPQPAISRRQTSFKASTPSTGSAKSVNKVGVVGKSPFKRGEVFELLIKGCLSEDVDPELLETIKSQASEFLFVRFRLVCQKKMSSFTIERCGKENADNVFKICNEFVQTQKIQRVGNPQDLDDLLAHYTPKDFKFCDQVASTIFVAIEYSRSKDFNSIMECRLQYDNKIWSAGPTNEKTLKVGYEIDMGVTGDHIGTMIAGFRDVEILLQQMAALSGLKTVSSQNLLQAVTNGFIHPTTYFERESVTFSSHQPAEEGQEEEEVFGDQY